MKRKRALAIEQTKVRIITFAGAILLNVVTVLFIITVPPDRSGALYFFFILIFSTILTFIYSLSQHFRRSLFVAIGLTVFLIFRYLELGTLINNLLLLSILISFEFYFTKKA